MTFFLQSISFFSTVTREILTLLLDIWELATPNLYSFKEMAYKLQNWGLPSLTFCHFFCPHIKHIIFLVETFGFIYFYHTLGRGGQLSISGSKFKYFFLNLGMISSDKNLMHISKYIKQIHFKNGFWKNHLRSCQDEYYRLLIDFKKLK